MRSILEYFLELLSRSQLVEFDYRDTTGRHHGRCYVRYPIGGRHLIKGLLRRYGYTNVHLA